MEDSYSKRGVSSAKEDVHNAIKNLSKGIFSNSFCKIYQTFWVTTQSIVSLCTQMVLELKAH